MNSERTERKTSPLCSASCVSPNSNDDVKSHRLMTDLARDEWTWSKFNDLGLQEFQALIVDYERKMVLLKRDEARWIMPAYVGDDDNYESSFLPEFVKEKIQEEVESSLDLCVLRQVWRKEMYIVKNNEGFTFEKAVVLVRFLSEDEGHSDGKRDIARKGIGEEYVWVALAHAEVYHLFPDARKTVAEEMKWITRDRVPENRLRWQHPRWMESTMSWMKDTLVRKREAQIVKPVFVERSTHYGTVIVAETTKGKFFLKCTPPWQNDAAYTDTLSRIAPKYVAAPVAVDVEKQVMITSDYGDILIPVMFNAEEEMRLTLAFVRMQQEAIGKVDELVCAGMPDFRADSLMKHMDWLVCNPMLGAIAERTEYKEAVKFLRENLNRLKRKVEELYRTGIPSTVTHNDLALSNVYKKEGCENLMFFDWVEGYVAHPLTGRLDGLTRSAYIREWEEYGNVEGLQKWLDPGQSVRILIECILVLLEAEKFENPERGDAFQKAAERVNAVFKCYSKEI